VLRNGALQQCDAPQVLYDRPKNIFVAGFIGSPAMNILEGSLSPDMAQLTLGSQKIMSSILVGRPGLAKYAGRALVVRIRPEDLPAAGPDHTGSVLVGDVHLVEALGAEILVHFHLDAPIVVVEDSLQAEDCDEILIGSGTSESECIARIEPRHKVQSGDRFSFGISEARLEFFDLDSGLAILD
jgi:multiple sugar transport system ATP-binding protein